METMSRAIVCSFLGLAALVALAGCDSAGDASCSICTESFTDDECMEIATSQGCTSGESYGDTLCSEPTRGCRFQGCPFGTPIACRVPPRDSGPRDAGVDAP